MPIEPSPSRWALPEPPFETGDVEVVGLGADLAPGTLLAAYRKGLFPMRLEAGGPVARGGHPTQRGILPLDGLRVSRSLRRSCRRYRTTVDEAFSEVVRGCADPSRPHGWIDEEFVAAYTELHRLGWAHSIEVWDDRGRDDESRDDESRDDAHDEPVLVGGLYGVAIGGAFAAESKFRRANDASKVAVVALVELLRAGGGALLDVQWTTEHLASLGATDVSRDEYGRRLDAALASPLPRIFADRSG